MFKTGKFASYEIYLVLFAKRVSSLKGVWVRHVKPYQHYQNIRASEAPTRRQSSTVNTQRMQEELPVGALAYNVSGCAAKSIFYCSYESQQWLL